MAICITPLAPSGSGASGKGWRHHSKGIPVQTVHQTKISSTRHRGTNGSHSPEKNHQPGQSIHPTRLSTKQTYEVLAPLSCTGHQHLLRSPTTVATSPKSSPEDATNPLPQEEVRIGRMYQTVCLQKSVLIVSVEDINQSQKVQSPL